MNRLDGATAALEFGADARVVRLEYETHVLGIHLLGARREADEVAEEAGHDLALLSRGRLRAEGCRALRAEPGVLGVLAAAAGTDLHVRRIGRPVRSPKAGAMAAA